MGKKDVKIVIDYKKGTYDVIGLHHNEIATIHIPIRVTGKGGLSEDNFSRKSIRMIRKEIKSKLKEMKKSNPRFKYSRSFIRKVDPLVFKALETWDVKEETTHATDYLRTITQSFEWMETPGMSDKVFEKRCQRARMTDLLEYGIDIVYNVGMLQTSKQLTFMDKIRGIRFAKNQEKLFGAKVQNSFVVKPDYYLEEINQFMYDIKNNDDRDMLNRIREVFAEIEYEKLNGEKLTDKEVLRHIQEVFAEIDEEQSLGRDLEDTEVLERIREVLVRIGEKNNAKGALRDKEVQRRIRESSAKKQENVLSDAEVQRRIRESLAKEQENIFKDKEVQRRIRESLAKEQKERALQDQELKRAVLEALGMKEEKELEKKVLTKPKVEETKKQKYKGKKRVRNHTGERVVPTKKQRESIARKEKKEQNSHYNTQMRLKAEKEERNRQAEVRIAKFQEEKRLEEARKTEEARIAAEAKKEETRVVEKTAKKLETEHWKRKTDSKTDSVRDKKYIQKEDKAKTLKNLASGRVKRRIQAEIRHWKRKLRNVRDSIKNKKFKPMADKTKRRIIAGAISVFAVGVIIASVHGGDFQSKNLLDNSAAVATATVMHGETEEVENSPEVVETQAPEVTPQPEVTQTPEVTPAPEVTPGPEIVTPEEPGNENPEGGKESVIPDNPNVEENTEGQIETEEEKLERFRQEALQMYQDALIIGETPQIGDILMDQKYYESPDGTGKFGYFATHPDYKISHINIVLETGWKVIRVEGKSLSEILAEYPDYVTYNIGFVSSKTDGGLGFVTQEQYEQVIQNKVDQIISSKTDKSVDLSTEELMR